MPPFAQALLARGLSPRVGLVLVVLAQCLGTSLWFSPAGASGGLMARWQLQSADFAWLLASTQLGFIAGTFLLAWTGVADRWRASRLFGLSCGLGAVANAALVWPDLSFAQAWWIRAGVGLCLAGIYPLGMKLVVQWVGGRPALALAWLVAMLTGGTAMPHALRAYGVVWPWEHVLWGASLLALVGGALVAAAGDGPFMVSNSNSNSNATAKGRPSNTVPMKMRWRALKERPALRASAFGYFGHMWELYAFWSVVPYLVSALWTASPPGSLWWVPGVIGAGAFGCLVGGYAARRWGSAIVAFVALAGSASVCAIYPWIPTDWLSVRLALLVLWGVLVVADSPQFSALSSQAAPPELMGQALVVQNGLGFLISVVSILVLGGWISTWGDRALWLLLPGPLLGLWAMRPLFQRADALGA